MFEALGKVNDPTSMRNNKLINDITELFRLLSGVYVLDKKATEEFLSIEFTVSDPLALLILHHVSEAANLPLKSWARFEPGTKEAEQNLNESVQYQFSCGGLPEANDKFCWLGANLTWQMYKLKVLTPEQEKTYCEKFGAQSRSA